MSDTLAYKRMAVRVRMLALKAMSGQMGGHVGGSMSIADTIAVLYTDKMALDPKDPQWSGRDWLVMSKGHCGPALYAALAIRGFLPEEVLPTMNSPRTILPSHCDRRKTPGVDMSTGSLGQGMSTALGVALGHKLQNMPNTTYLILGDGECDEGQVWEGALFAAAKKLDNVIAFVDYNKKQLDGYTKDICDLGDIAQKFADFGWYAQDIDGHDVDAISAAIDKAKAEQGRPSVIVLNTVKGKGCTFAEDVLMNHHISFNQEQLDEAMAALQRQLDELN